MWESESRNTGYRTIVSIRTNPRRPKNQRRFTTARARHQNMPNAHPAMRSLQTSRTLSSVDIRLRSAIERRNRYGSSFSGNTTCYRQMTPMPERNFLASLDAIAMRGMGKKDKQTLFVRKITFGCWSFAYSRKKVEGHRCTWNPTRRILGSTRTTRRKIRHSMAKRDRPMKPEHFFRLVAKMRECQKRYFRTRSQKVLRECRFYESQIDTEIERVNKVLSEKNPELDFKARTVKHICRNK